MAIDEALFTLNQEPTLRFYSWSRPTLSVGYFQKVDKNLLKKCKKDGIDVVRRLTGGRAVLHNHEITYSVSATYSDFPSSSSLQAIYKTLATWQIAAFAKVGIDAKLSDSSKSKKQSYICNDSCFLTTLPSEVVVNGKKICGSAQKRGLRSFLQHGSIPLSLNEDQFIDITGEKKSALQTFTTMNNEGYTGTAEHFISILSHTFRDIIGCDLKKQDILHDECEYARTLRLSVSL